MTKPISRRPVISKPEFLTNPVYIAADKFVRDQIEEGLADEGVSTTELSDAAQPHIEAIIQCEIVALLLSLAANTQDHHKRTLADYYMQSMADRTD